jgi:hypothetical protein
LPAADPVTVAKQALASSQAQDWPRLLTRIHPRAIQDFKQDQIRLLLDAFPADLATLPDSIRQRMVDARRARDRFTRKYTALVYGLTTPDDLRALPAESVLVRYLRFLHGGDDLTSQPVILGTVPDGDSVAALVLHHREHDELGGPWSRSLVTLRRHQGAWHLMLDGGLLFPEGSLTFDFRTLDSQPPAASDSAR